MSTSPLYPSVSLLNTEQREIYSTIVGQKYLIKVRLPERYHENPDQIYPVLYLLDGDHAFGMAADIVQYLIYGGHIPDLIIVSPAYGSKLGLSEGGSNMRDRDLLPYQISWLDYSIYPPPGGENYLRFLEQELIPFAEGEYRINSSDRALWGYSSGGIFLFYSLFSKPGLFQRYLLIDGWEGKLMEIEARYAESHSILPAKLYIGMGATVSNPEVVQIVETLKARKYRDFVYEYDILNNIGHFAVAAEGLTKGLVWVFGDVREDL